MNKTITFFYDFQENSKQFLRLGKNIDESLIGADLNDCLNFNPNQDKGTEFNRNSIPIITESVYQSFCRFLENRPEFNLEKGQIRIFIYSLVRTGCFDILCVYRIETKKIKTKRKKWIRKYVQLVEHTKFEPRLCCIKKFLPPDEQNIQLDEKSLEERNKKLYKSCCFPKTIIDTEFEFSGYLLNPDDPQVDECFSETEELFLVIIPFKEVSIHKFNLGLAIKDYTPPGFPLCTDLYTELSVKNLADFINDCFITCIDWQNGLVEDEPRLKKEEISNELLYLTIESIN